MTTLHDESPATERPPVCSACQGYGFTSPDPESADQCWKCGLTVAEAIGIRPATLCVDADCCALGLCAACLLRGAAEMS